MSGTREMNERRGASASPRELAGESRKPREPARPRAVCHGRLGNGKGMIVQRGFLQPPSFHIERLKDPKRTPDAHFYNVITYGYGAMFSYNDRVSPRDRWCITAYIRALQAAGDAPGL